MKINALEWFIRQTGDHQISMHSTAGGASTFLVLPVHESLTASTFGFRIARSPQLHRFFGFWVACIPNCIDFLDFGLHASPTASIFGIWGCTHPQLHRFLGFGVARVPNCIDFWDKSCHTAPTALILGIWSCHTALTASIFGIWGMQLHGSLGFGVVMDTQQHFFRSAIDL